MSGMIFVNFPCLIELEHSALWNTLPDTVVKAESVNSFKGRLDRFWNDQEVNIIGKLTLKVPEAEVMYYKFNLIILNFYTVVIRYTGHRGN